jgi:hypothetical protein
MDRNVSSNERPRGDIDVSQSGEIGSLGWRYDATKPGMAIVVKEFIGKDNSWGDDFYDITFYDALCLLRIFHLFAYGNAESGAYKLRQIVVELMMRETSQRHLGSASIVPLGEGNATRLCGLNGVVTKCLKEVSQTEEQDCVGVPRFDLAILPHEGCFFIGHGLENYGFAGH